MTMIWTVPGQGTARTGANATARPYASVGVLHPLIRDREHGPARTRPSAPCGRGRIPVQAAR
ncbi:hypothetical protein [Streptomyces sp. NPDC002851]